MHSPVAAVKAPRTHNRRRVTGSSGRRRGGGESEPQRPNMSRHLFCSAVVLLLFMMMCCDTGAAAEDETASCPESSKSKRFVWRDVKGEETVSLLRVPSLVEMKGDVFAVAEAQYKKKEYTFTGIASELLKLSDGTPKALETTQVKTEVLEECSTDGGECPSQTVVAAASQSGTGVLVFRPTTVVRGSDIYMLAGIYINENARNCEAVASEATPFELLLVKGNVSGEGSKNRIFWNDTYVIPWDSNDEQLKSLNSVIGGGGSGVKMDDGTLVFPVEAKKKENGGTEDDGKTVSLILYSSRDNKIWKLSKGMSDGGCGDPSVVEWEKDKLMMMTVCDDGRRRVYESGDKGDLWTEALGTLSRVWGSPKEGKRRGRDAKSGFITAKFEDRDVMLVTLPVYSSRNGEDNRNGELRLWLTDNTHIVDIGPISGEDEEDVAASSLLYKSGKDNNEEKLIALYEKKRGNGRSSLGMVSVLLTEQLQRVKDVLATWKEVDERVSKLCPSGSPEKSASPDDACSAVKVTAGLVGFLSGNFFDKTWRDEYLGVNATVKVNDGGAAAATVDSEKGVKFQGAWAEWPVGEQGENQLYHFANYNFTLVATVSIDGEPTQDGTIPVVGVRLDGEDKLMELSYKKEKKWELLCDGEPTTEHSRGWEPGTTHQLVLMLQNGTHGSAYVDGQRVGEAPCALENKDSKGISHFYIGGDGGSADNKRGQEGVSATVTNVLLYNRPLTFSEITALKPNKAPIPSPVNTPIAGTAIQSTPGGSQQTKQESLMGSSGANGETAGISNGQGIHAQDKEVNATALSSSVGNLSQGITTTLAPCVRAEWCHRCFFCCWDCGGLRHCEE
ncbi:putative trans-sialidase [Trypanosoma cruzi]|uniref:Putative trans-sialidase n=1 Tax=Trypanosoma cruzi TaxID=5693 RepID=A0A2V2XB01_TRYCR|nr:putative trans-sialidase [Trypanosoma cruzi]